MKAMPSGPKLDRSPASAPLGKRGRRRNGKSNRRRDYFGWASAFKVASKSGCTWMSLFLRT